MSLEEYRSVHQLCGLEWDRLLGHRGTFGHQGLAFLERTFRSNAEKENNWEFYYFIIRDEAEQPVLATFFTHCICKDDIFKPPAVSKRLEALRAADPYLMTTESLMMGSQLTEGEHLYLNREHALWKDALMQLLERLNVLKEEARANAVYLRDFDTGDHELQDLLVGNGFVEVELPDFAHVSTHFGWDTEEEFLAPLSSKKRQQLRRDTFGFEDRYDVVVKKTTDEEELRKLYELYQNVKRDSFVLNTFDLPFKVFMNMNDDPRWEMIILKLVEGEYLSNIEGEPVAVIFSYLAGSAYIPLLVGLDYRYLRTHKNYKQACWQVVKRANALGAKTLYFGITATVEKKRLGAEAIPKVSYVQYADSFDLERLELASLASLERLVPTGS